MHHARQAQDLLAKLSTDGCARDCDHAEQAHPTHIQCEAAAEPQGLHLPWLCWLDMPVFRRHQVGCRR